jgi:iron complex outermembrane receptor protein
MNEQDGEKAMSIDSKTLLRCGCTRLVTATMGAMAMSVGVGVAYADAANPVSDTASAGGGELQEIIVTARFRSETLQKTPIAITALSGADLEARGIVDVTGLTASVPSTQLVKEGSTGGNTLVAYIRGLGQANYSLSFQPGVPIYLDDIYQPTAFGSLMTLGDIERVDVLRGPQGTLFGRNSEGGAISIRSVDPKGDGSGYFEAGAGSYAERRFRGAFDFALIPDKLFVRIAGGSETMNGYVDRIDYVCANPGASGKLMPTTGSSNCNVGTEGGLDDTFGRLALKWLINDDVTARLSASTFHNNDEAVPEVPLIINPAYPGSDLAAYNARVAVPLFGIPINSKMISSNPYVNYATFSNPANGLVFSPYSPQTSWDITGKLDWNLPFGMTFTSISGYHNLNGTIPEYKNGPIPINMVQNTIKYDSYSEEDRLSGSAFDNRFEWTAGIYYFHGKGAQIGDINLAASQVGPYFGINETLDSPTSSSNESGYLHGLYHFTDKLSLELGVRYSHDVFNYVYEGTNLAQVPANPIKAPGSPVFGPDQPLEVESKDSRFDPKVALQYQWTQDFMTYAQFGTGFKGGGANPTPITAAQATPFSIEQLKAYEIGAKTQFFDRRVTLNVDGYWNNVTGLQLIGFAPTTIGGTITLNAGQALIKGLEAEVQARPIPALLFNASADYMHFRYVSLGAAAFSPGNAGGLFLNDVAPFSPEYKGNLGIQYTQQIGALGSLTPRLDYTYQTRVYFDAQNLPASSQGGYGLMNGHLSWAPVEGKWLVSVDVNNALNKLYYLSMFNQLSSFGILTGQPAQPRTVFASVKYTF